MQFSLENRGRIRADETGLQFNARAQRVLAEARSLSEGLCNGLSELNRWMGLAKSREMTWMEGLYFSIDCMQAKASDTALPSRGDHGRLS
jgi:hypothetical protein